MSEPIETFDWKKYFKLISTAGNLSIRGNPDSNSCFEENSEVFLKIFLPDNDIISEDQLDKIDLLKELIKGRNKFEIENLKLFIHNLRHVLLVKVFKTWNNFSSDNFIQDRMETFINSTISEMKLLSFIYDEETGSKGFISCFYPDPEKYIKEKDGIQIKEIFCNVQNYVENENSGIEQIILQCLGRVDLPDTITREKLSKVIKYSYNLYEYRNIVNETYETFCVLAEDEDSTILISSLEIIKTEPTITNNDELDEENIFILSLENVPEISNTNSEKIIRRNIKQLVGFICQKEPELKQELLSNKYLFTLRPVKPVKTSNRIKGDSLNFPLFLLLFSAKMYMNPLSLESASCLTGDIVYNPVENGSTWLIRKVDKAKDKISAIRKYNQNQLFGRIKVLFIPDESRRFFKTEMESEGIKVVDSYQEVTEENQIYLKVVKDLLEIDFIDQFIHYIQNKSRYFGGSLNENIPDCLTDFKDYICSLRDERLNETERFKILTDTENDSCLLDKEGIILSTFITDKPEIIAKYLCSFLAFNRAKLNFTRIPVPIMLSLGRFENKAFNPEEYIFSVFKEYKIPVNVIYNFLKTPYSFIFIIFDENVEDTENPFRGEDLISGLLGKHYVICCANSYEQGNFWQKKIKFVSVYV